MPIYVFDQIVGFPIAVKAETRKEAQALAEENNYNEFRQWSWDAIAMRPEYVREMANLDELGPDFTKEDAPVGSDESYEEIFKR
jgi:hypothetical protein